DPEGSCRHDSCWANYDGTTTCCDCYSGGDTGTACTTYTRHCDSRRRCIYTEETRYYSDNGCMKQTNDP
ncbi:MAG: hypothetical protein ACT4PT_07460, partial [Methanobacteriota archaeon]